MRRHRWLSRSVALVTVFLGATALPVGRASADTVAAKRAEAARLAAQIDADGQRVDALTARYQSAQLAEAKVNARLADATNSLKVVTQRIAETRGAVRDLAVGDFMRGRRNATAASVPRPDDPQGSLAARLYADLAMSDTQDVLDANRAAQEDYQVQLAQLEIEQKRAHAVAANLQSARQAAEQAVAAQQAHLNKVRGDLAALVAAERARQRAAREAATRASVSQHGTPPRPGGATGHPVDANRAGAAVAEARRQLGKPYHWGAAGPNSFDCSGLTLWAWRAGGVSLPHHAASQYSATIHIPLDQLQPGDLVFFHRNLSHVGIYVGNGQMIHAPETGDVVRYASIYSEGGPIYAGRVTG
jgi:cell wall-associated NlpC family hydrolase